MITRLWLGTRRDGLDRAAFSAHWHDVHGSYGLAIPGLRAYVQNHLLDDASPLGHPWFDGCSELDFDDVPAMVAAFASPELDAADADERAFADPDRFGVVVTERHLLVGSLTADTPARFLLFVRGPGSDERDAAATLLTDRAEEVGAVRAELLVAVADAPQPQSADHVHSLWFPTIDALRAGAPEWLAIVRESDPSGSVERWPAMVAPRRLR